MNKAIIGTCSICGGTVSVPTVFHSVTPPVPTCESCGAQKKSTLPVVEMENDIKENRKFLTETNKPFRMCQN